MTQPDDREAYLPLTPASGERNRKIWEETGKKLGIAPSDHSWVTKAEELREQGKGSAFGQ